MTAFTEDRLQIDAARVRRDIADSLRRQVGEVLGRAGIVVAISGGVDSAVCAALAVDAVGAKHVAGLSMPERESNPDATVLAREWASALGITFFEEDITQALDACGCYARRDNAVRRVVPEYGADWRCKLVLETGGLQHGRFNVWCLDVQSPHGESRRVRLPSREYREIVAATNYKQRVRKITEYYHADRLQYAVIGTANRLEHDQGFFVKGGDGLADVKPIAHLYKSQVYQLAEHVGVPKAIRARTPTTDTYSLPQTQEEFFFTLPLHELDIVLEAHNAGRAAADVAAELGRDTPAIDRAFREIERKRVATRYLHATPLLTAPVCEVGGALPGTG